MQSSRLNTAGERQCADLSDEYKEGYLPFVFKERRSLISISMRPHSAALSQAEGPPFVSRIWQSASSATLGKAWIPKSHYSYFHHRFDALVCFRAQGLTLQELSSLTSRAQPAHTERNQDLLLQTEPLCWSTSTELKLNKEPWMLCQLLPIVHALPWCVISEQVLSIG